MQNQQLIGSAAYVAESIKSLEDLVKTSIVPSTTGAVAPVRQLRASSAPRREEPKFTNRQVASEVLIANSKFAATKPLRPDRALSERPRPSHPGEPTGNEPRLTQERLLQYAAAHARLTAPPRPGPRSTAGSTLMRKITNLAALLPLATQSPAPPGTSLAPVIPLATAAAVLNGIPPVRTISSSPAGLTASALGGGGRISLNSPGVPFPGMGPPTGVRPTSAAPHPRSPRQAPVRSGSFQQPPQPPQPSSAPQHQPPAAQQQRRQGAWGPTQPSPSSVAGAASPGMPPPDRAFGPRASNYPSRVPATPPPGAPRPGTSGGPSGDPAAASPGPRWQPHAHMQNQQQQNQVHQGVSTQHQHQHQQNPASYKQRSDDFPSQLPPRPGSVRGQRGPPPAHPPHQHQHHVGADIWTAGQVRLDSPRALSPREEGRGGGGADAGVGGGVGGGMGPKSRSASPHPLPQHAAARQPSPQSPPLPHQQTLTQQRQQEHNFTQPHLHQASYPQGDDNRGGGGGAGAAARPWTARRRPQSCAAGPAGSGSPAAAANGADGGGVGAGAGSGPGQGTTAWPPVVIGLRDVAPSQLPGCVGGGSGAGRASDDGTHASWWQNGTADSEASYPMTAVTDRHAPKDRMTPSEAALCLGRMAELEAEVLEEREFRRKYEDELKRLAVATRSKTGQSGSGGNPAMWQTSGGRVLTGARAAAAAVARHRWGVTS